MTARWPVPVDLHQLNQRVFRLGAGFYDWATRQETWRAHCASLADDFPEAPAHRPLRVLDLGIGPGISGIGLLDRRPDAAIVGVDWSGPMLSRAKANLERAGRQLDLVRADASRLPFADRSFDVVTQHSFLYLVSDKRNVLESVHGLLRPGGRYVLLEPASDGRVRAIPAMHGSLRFKVSMLCWRVVSRGYGRFDAGGLAGLLARHGFERIQVRGTLDGLGLLATASAAPGPVDDAGRRPPA